MLRKSQELQPNLTMSIEIKINMAIHTSNSSIRSILPKTPERKERVKRMAFVFSNPEHTGIKVTLKMPAIKQTIGVQNGFDTVMLLTERDEYSQITSESQSGTWWSLQIDHRRQISSLQSNNRREESKLTQRSGSRTIEMIGTSDQTKTPS